MQGGKSSTSAVEAAKEAAANVGASAWAGKEKTKAVMQGTVEKVKARDPAAKASAEARKQERVQEVEAVKRDAMRHNAAAKERASAASYHPTTGAVATDRSASATGAVEMEGTRPVQAAADTSTEAGPPAATAAHVDVPRDAGSDDGDLPPMVSKSDGDPPAPRGTAGGHSASA